MRYIQRLKLTPGEYPPQFDEEVNNTLQRKVPEGSKHGKVVNTSYLLQQLALATCGALAIFGDGLSDVYMGYTLDSGAAYSNLTLPGVLPGSDLKEEYIFVTCLSIGLWLGVTFLTTLYLMICDPKLHQLRSESLIRSFLHSLALWIYLAFNLPWWMLDITDPEVIVKIFTVKDRKGRCHNGFIYATKDYSKWKGTGKLAQFFQLPSILLEDLWLSVLNMRIWQEVGWTLPNTVSLGFALFSLVYKLNVLWPILRACLCQKSVNKTAVQLDDWQPYADTPQEPITTDKRTPAQRPSVLSNKATATPCTGRVGFTNESTPRSKTPNRTPRSKTPNRTPLSPLNKLGSRANRGNDDEEIQALMSDDCEPGHQHGSGGATEKSLRRASVIGKLADLGRGMFSPPNIHGAPCSAHPKKQPRPRSTPGPVPSSGTCVASPQARRETKSLGAVPEAITIEMRCPAVAQRATGAAGAADTAVGGSVDTAALETAAVNSTVIETTAIASEDTEMAVVATSAMKTVDTCTCSCTETAVMATAAFETTTMNTAAIKTAAIEMAAIEMAAKDEEGEEMSHDPPAVHPTDFDDGAGVARRSVAMYDAEVMQPAPAAPSIFGAVEEMAGGRPNAPRSTTPEQQTSSTTSLSTTPPPPPPPPPSRCPWRPTTPEQQTSPATSLSTTAPVPLPPPPPSRCTSQQPQQQPSPATSLPSATPPLHETWRDHASLSQMLIEHRKHSPPSLRSYSLDSLTETQTAVIPQALAVPSGTPSMQRRNTLVTGHL